MLTLHVAVKWSQIIYCRIGWQLTSDEGWNTELMNSRAESNILKRLIFYSTARWREIIDENVKAPHHCDWTVTIHVITYKYLGQGFLTFFTYLTPVYQTRLSDLPQYTQWCSFLKNMKLTKFCSLEWFIKIYICCKLWFSKFTPFED